MAVQLRGLPGCRPGGHVAVPRISAGDPIAHAAERAGRGAGHDRAGHGPVAARHLPGRPRQRWYCPEALAPALGLLQPPPLVRWCAPAEAPPAVGARIVPAIYSRLLSGRCLGGIVAGLPLPIEPAHPKGADARESSAGEAPAAVPAVQRGVQRSSEAGRGRNEGCGSRPAEIGAAEPRGHPPAPGAGCGGQLGGRAPPLGAQRERRGKPAYGTDAEARLGSPGLEPVPGRAGDGDEHQVDPNVLSCSSIMRRSTRPFRPIIN